MVCSVCVALFGCLSKSPTILCGYPVDDGAIVRLRLLDLVHNIWACARLCCADIGCSLLSSEVDEVRRAIIDCEHILECRGARLFSVIVRLLDEPPPFFLEKPVNLQAELIDLLLSSLLYSMCVCNRMLCFLLCRKSTRRSDVSSAWVQTDIGEI